MTESVTNNTNNSNGIDKDHDNTESSDEVVQTKVTMRPTGIPRLISSSSQRYSTSSTEDRNIKSRIPISPNKVNSARPKSIGSYSKSPCQDSHFRDLMISPSYTKRSSRDAFSFNKSTKPESRHRITAQSLNRYDRAVSEENQGRKSVESSYSELTNNSGSTELTRELQDGGSICIITSKIGSLTNARHKPGGGNVKIFEEKKDFSNVESRCGSKKNIKYKPGGGDVEIVSKKLEFSKTAESKVNSLKNIKHQPQGGDVKIDNRKLEWNTNSKIGSMDNMKHRPGGGAVQIVNQQLPWLRYNKPNLPPEELAKIQKKTFKEFSKETTSTSSPTFSHSPCSDHY